MNNYTKNKNLNWFGIMLVALSLSPFCVIITTTFLPVNFSEIFLFPGLVLIYYTNRSFKNSIKRTIVNKKFALSFILLTIFFAIGLLTGDNIAYCYSDFRSIFFFLFLLFLSINKIDRPDILVIIEKIFFALCVIDMTYIFLGLGGIVEISSRNIIQVIAPFVLSLKYLSELKYLKSFIFFVILTFEAIISVMRVNYLFVALYILILLVYLINSSANKKISFHKTLSYVFFFSLLISISIPIIWSYINADDSRYYHTIYRMELIFKSKDEDPNVDDTRFNTNYVILKEGDKLLIPQGLGWRNHIQDIQKEFADYEVKSSMDSNILYNAYHFGLILGLFITFALLYYFLSLIVKMFLKYKLKDSIISISIIITIIFMFVLKSWLFVYLNISISYMLAFIYAKEILKLRAYNHNT